MKDKQRRKFCSFSFIFSKERLYDKNNSAKTAKTNKTKTPTKH